jgi:hypothetical protein
MGLSTSTLGLGEIGHFLHVFHISGPRWVPAGENQNPHPPRPVSGPRTRKPAGHKVHPTPTPTGLKLAGFGLKPDPLPSLEVPEGGPRSKILPRTHHGVKDDHRCIGGRIYHRAYADSSFHSILEGRR